MNYKSYVSIFVAYTAFDSMKSRRGSTLSPIKISNNWSHIIASSILTFSNVLVSLYKLYDLSFFMKFLAHSKTDSSLLILASPIVMDISS